MNEPRDKNGLTESEFLARYDAGRYERPSVTVDIILISRNKVLLIRRGGHPFIGKLALPGGFLEPNEDAYTAAARELLEETGLKAKALKMLSAATKPDRDPRTRIVTLPFLAEVDGDPTLATAGDDAIDAKWYDFHVTRNGVGKCIVTVGLSSGDENIKIELEKTCPNRDELRFDPIYTVIGDTPLAGDHAEILAMALEKYESNAF